MTTTKPPITQNIVKSLSPLDQIRYYMGNPPSGSILMTITPTLAQEILDNLNKNNRPLKPTKIGEYVNDIKNSKWVVTGDTIKFSDTKLLDGQNRLTACVKANMPIQTHVLFGIKNGAFTYMDRGRNRTGGDILKIAGYSNYVNLSSAINWVSRLENAITFGSLDRGVLNPEQQLTMVQTHYSKLPMFMQQGARIYTNTDYPAGACAALLYMFDQINPKAAVIFADAWEHGNYVRAPSIQTYNTKMVKTSTLYGPVPEVPRTAYLITAWNLFRAHRRGRQQDFSWTSAQPFPKIVP